MTPTLRSWLAPRARLVGRAALAGLLAGALGVVVVALLAGDVTLASEQVFSLAALVFGFGLLGWSGSAMFGRAVETTQEYMETGSNWTEASSRRAMARVLGFGLGGMVGAIIGTLLVG